MSRVLVLYFSLEDRLCSLQNIRDTEIPPIPPRVVIFCFFIRVLSCLNDMTDSCRVQVIKLARFDACMAEKNPTHPLYIYISKKYPQTSI